MFVSCACLLCCLAMTAGEAKPAEGYPRPNLLIEAADLADPATGARYHVLDPRPRPSYLAGHVPGAVWVDHAAWSQAFAAGQDPAEWSRRVGELGLTPETPVVVYDDGSAKDAARIWWILQFWGFRDVRLLNGGWPAWEAAGGKVSREPVRPAAVDVKLSPHPEYLATKDQVMKLVGRKDAQIIDARSEKEYCGETQTAKRNGAIPGAVHLEWVEVLDPKTHRFKSAAELSRLFREAGIDPDRPAVTHCQSGGRASVLAFALELMGKKHVRNYYRSWAEWGNAEDTPIEKPSPK